MEILLFLLVGLFIMIYLFRPISKYDEEHFKNKNNWRGGF